MREYCRKSRNPSVLHKTIRREKHEQYRSRHCQIFTPQPSSDCSRAYDDNALRKRQITVCIRHSNTQQQPVNSETVNIYIINAVCQKSDKCKSAYNFVYAEHSAYTAHADRVTYRTTQKTYYDKTDRIYYPLEIYISWEIHKHSGQRAERGINNYRIQSHRLGKQIVEILCRYHYYDGCDCVDYAPKSMVENKRNGKIHRA